MIQVPPHLETVDINCDNLPDNITINKQILIKIISALNTSLSLLRLNPANRFAIYGINTALELLVKQKRTRAIEPGKYKYHEIEPIEDIDQMARVLEEQNIGASDQTKRIVV